MIPTRFSEHRFRLFEPLLARVVSEFPFAVDDDNPSRHITPDTRANQIRDAAKSYISHRWVTDAFTYDQFTSCWEMCRVQVRDYGTIRIGPRNAEPRPQPKTANGSVPTDKIGLNVESADLESARHIVLLHAKGIIVEPTHFVSLTLLTPLQVFIESENLNAVCQPLSDGNGFLVF